MIVNQIAAMQGEITAWRRDFHAHPELMFDVHRTAAVVAELLTSFGCDGVVTGLGRTGVVGLIHGGSSRRAIGLRADMDALPITEETGRPYRSTVAGKMHACGHDGHTAMLLGAAKYSAATRRFNGTAVVIFQPAEEGGGGGKAMVDDGLMDRFAVEEVYGLHNLPGLAVGRFATRPGSIMASADRIAITVEGRGGHAARPNLCVDPIVVGADMITRIQAIVARNVDPLDAAVISITQFQAGTTDNVIPSTAILRGTARALTPSVRDLLEARLAHVVDLTAQAHGATARLTYARGYPVVCNHPAQTHFAATVAAEVAGMAAVDTAMPPIMGAEDFAYMLQARPGAFVFLGNGDTAGLHHPAYDFNDELIPYGASYWARLIETALA